MQHRTHPALFRNCLRRYRTRSAYFAIAKKIQKPLENVFILWYTVMCEQQRENVFYFCVVIYKINVCSKADLR